MLQVCEELFTSLCQIFGGAAQKLLPGGVTPHQPATSHGAGFIYQSPDEPRVYAQSHRFGALLAGCGGGVCVNRDATATRQILALDNPISIG